MTDKTDHVAAALDRILCAACGYSEWVSVGMALHHAEAAGEVRDGLALWDAWSRKDADRYKSGETVRRWAGFARGSGKDTTLGTLLHLARQHGWDGQTARGHWSVVSGQTDCDSVPAARTSRTKADAEAKTRKRRTKCWAALRTHGEPLSSDAAHPVRCWVELRKLWPPDAALPPGLAWLPAAAPFFKGRHQGAGALVALIAPLAAWQAAHPKYPNPIGFELVSIAYDGSKSQEYLGARRDKLTHGFKASACFLIRAEATGKLHVAEGLASALRIARYEAGAVACTFGAGGLGRCYTWDGIERYSDVHLWPDRDDDGEGEAAARRAASGLIKRGIPYEIHHVPRSCDPATAPLWKPKHDSPPHGDCDDDAAIAAAYSELLESLAE